MLTQILVPWRKWRRAAGACLVDVTEEAAFADALTRMAFDDTLVAELRDQDRAATATDLAPIRPGAP